MSQELSNRRNVDLLTLMFSADLLILAICWNGAYFLRFHVISPPISGVPFHEYFPVTFLILLLGAIILPFGKLYDSRCLARARLSLVPLLVSLVLLLGCLTFFFFFYRELSFSRLTTLIFFITTFSVMIAFRVALKRFTMKQRKKGKMLKNALVIGGGGNAAKLCEELGDYAQHGLRIVGYAAEKPSEEMGNYLGGHDRIDELLSRERVDQVYIALNAEYRSEAENINKVLAKHAVDLFVIPEIPDSLNIRPEAFNLSGLAVLSIRQSPLYGFNSYVKRTLDVTLAIFFIALLSPLFVGIALAVKLGSRGPALYRQKRMGLDGEIFEIYKFRSMVADAEKSTGAVWASKDDRRVTPLGAFLRKTSLDEIPQFFNVLEGSMSIVGPRPERPELIERFKEDIPYYMQRHRIKAGITGWAQINGLRGNTSLEKRVEADLYYIANWSVLLDLKIVLVTAFKVLRDKNAY